MSSESFGGGVNDEQDAWLRNSLYGIYAEIPIEDDCETLSAQLCRDMYRAAEGKDFDLAGAAEVVVYQNKHALRLAPIGETPQGIVCEWLNPTDPSEEPELVFVCGTLFELSIDPAAEKIEFDIPDVWPKTSEPIVTESSPTGRAAIMLNRRVATCGHLAIRLSYSPKEFNEYREKNPAQFHPSNFGRFEKDVKGVHCIRAVPENVTYLLNTTGIAITDLKGNKTIFGVAA